MHYGRLGSFKRRSSRPQGKGDALETFVERLLTLMGYIVRRNELISGTQIDLVAHRNDPLDNLRLIVECANRNEPLGVPLLKQKAAILLNPANSRYLHRLLVVSAGGFTAEAKVYAENSPQIMLLDPQELERQLVNFQPGPRLRRIEQPVTLGQRKGYRARERARSYGPVCIRAYAALSAWLREGE